MRSFHFTSTESTNSAARRLAAEHLGATLLVTADVQTAGRGRGGRAWRSPVGGAWFSVVISVEQPLPTAPLSVGLAVRNILAALIDNECDVTIKWPNDVLLADRKVAGVLCEQIFSGPLSHRERAGVRGCVVGERHEMKPETPTDGVSPHPNPLPEGEGVRPVTLILGVGINVNNAAADLPDLRHPATSLIEALGQRCDLQRIIRDVADAIAQTIAHPFVADDVRPHLAWINAPVCVTLNNREQHGTFIGIDDQGRLRLRTGDDTLTLDAGDVGKIRKAGERKA